MAGVRTIQKHYRINKWHAEPETLPILTHQVVTPHNSRRIRQGTRRVLFQQQGTINPILNTVIVLPNISLKARPEMAKLPSSLIASQNKASEYRNAKYPAQTRQLYNH